MNRASDSSASYDRVPYTSLSYSETHPDRLATIARLFGMSPPPVTDCRVLEMGCASGGNLIPMAYSLPGSEFVGVDLSARQIALGKEMVRAAGLSNVTLRELDIRRIDAGMGQFDYIIAHGVYSWVPTDVRDHVLRVCRENLAPNGVAYVSYNTYPGWHMMNIVRDMMRYHTREVDDPREVVKRARELIGFMAGAVPDGNNAYGAFLRMYDRMLHEQRETSKGGDDSFILHDELEEVNAPVYFERFVAHAEQHGLQYLSEAQYHKTFPGEFPPQVRAGLEQLARDRIEFEQYLDFVRNRTFRQTLLCHQEVSLRRTLRAEDMAGFYVASRARPVAASPDARAGVVEQFRSRDGATLSTDHPVTKVAMAYLGEVWPRAVRFDALLNQARATLGAQATSDAEQDARALAANLLRAYGYSDQLVEWHVYEPPFTVDIGERPLASPIARLQARERFTVTNLRHERVRLDALSRRLLLCLDGSRDRQRVVECVLAGVRAGEGQSVEELRDTLAAEVDAAMHWLADAALLIESRGEI